MFKREYEIRFALSGCSLDWAPVKVKARTPERAVSIGAVQVLEEYGNCGWPYATAELLDVWTWKRGYHYQVPVHRDYHSYRKDKDKPVVNESLETAEFRRVHNG